MEGRTGLPSPSYRGTRTLEETLARRRLDLAFLDRPLELAAMDKFYGQERAFGIGLAGAQWLLTGDEPRWFSMQSRPKLCHCTCPKSMR